jgi:hypothetical protein
MTGAAPRDLPPDDPREQAPDDTRDDPRDPADPADPVFPADGPFPAAFHFGPAHLIVYGNPPFVAAYGVASIGQPAREAMLDLPRGAFELMDRVLREGHPLARQVVVGGRERRLVVVPRREINSTETYGVATHLRSPSRG